MYCIRCCCCSAAARSAAAASNAAAALAVALSAAAALAAAVGCHLLLLLQAALAAPLQGLPLAAPLQLLLPIQGWTIVCRAVLPLPGLELTTSPLALANQQLFC